MDPALSSRTPGLKAGLVWIWTKDYCFFITVLAHSLLVTHSQSAETAHTK